MISLFQLSDSLINNNLQNEDWIEKRHIFIKVTRINLLRLVNIFAMLDIQVVVCAITHVINVLIESYLV